MNLDVHKQCWKGIVCSCSWATSLFTHCLALSVSCCYLFHPHQETTHIQDSTRGNQMSWRQKGKALPCVAAAFSKRVVSFPRILILKIFPFLTILLFYFAGKFPRDQNMREWRKVNGKWPGEFLHFLSDRSFLPFDPELNSFCGLYIHLHHSSCLLASFRM